jgi:hypothetical protein
MLDWPMTTASGSILWVTAELSDGGYILDFVYRNVRSNVEIIRHTPQEHLVFSVRFA